MRKHRGLLIFGVAVVLACMVYLGPLRSEQRRRDDLRDAALRPKIEALTVRLGHARESDVAALTDLGNRLSEIFPAPQGRWSRFAQDGDPRLGGDFHDAFMAWHGRLLEDGIITPRAWPHRGWRAGDRYPSDREMAKTLPLCLLVEGFGRTLASESGGVITGILEPDHPDDVVLDFTFEPDRVRGLLDALTGTLLGDEPFELVAFETKVRESGPGTGHARLRLVATK